MALSCSALMSAMLPAPSAAQSDSDFENYLAELCIFGLPPDPSDQLLELCNDFLQGFGGAPGQAGTFSSSNLGVIGAQDRTSNSSLRQQKQIIEEQMQQNEEDPGVRGAAAGGDFRLGNLGLFVAYNVGEGDRKPTALESGFEADIRGTTGGLNYLFGDRLVGGVLVGYNKHESDFDAGGGALDSRSRSISAYLTWTPLDNAYLGAYAGYASLDQHSERAIRLGTQTDTALASPEGDQHVLGISAGYDHYMGATSVGVFAGVDYAASDIDSYQETDTLGLALTFAEQRIRSVKSTMGLRADHTSQFRWGSLVPNVRVSWVHEYQDDARSISAALASAPTSRFLLRTDRPDRDYILLGLGVTANPSDTVQIFVDYERMAGHSFLDSWMLTGGVVANF
jgi:outer membrane autotransporter protein